MNILNELRISVAQVNALQAPAIARLHQKKRYKKRMALEEHQYHIKMMRSKLPTLTKAEIRRFRIPFHEALVAELQEDGYRNAAVFLMQLFTYQEEYRNDHSYDVIIQARPVLTTDRDELIYLYDNLKKAEAAHYRNDYSNEIDELLKIAYKYAFGPVDWWWLAEQFFVQCINISEQYYSDDRFRYTMTYYLYGKYLIEQPRIIPLGMQFLNVAREYSVGKEWSAGKISGHIEKYIFVEVCTVLYHTLMDQARAVLLKYPAWALELTLEARQRGIDACLPRADVFHLLAQCEMANQQPGQAVGNFMKAFLLYKTSGLKEQCCEAMIGVAQAFQEMGHLNQNKEQLERLLQFALKENLRSYVGQAYLYIGQFYLNAGQAESASPYLSNALNIFHEINDVARREFVKNLGAVSKGQETFQAYVKLILRCEDMSNRPRRGRTLMRLLRWKDFRTPFWDEMTESISEVSLGEEEMTVWQESEARRMSYHLEESQQEESLPEEATLTDL